MWNRRDVLMSVARHMETLAKDVKKHANDRMCQRYFWVWLWGGNVFGMAIVLIR